MLNYLDIMDAVCSAYECNKTIEYLIIKTAIDDGSAKYIADRINEIFSRQNEVKSFEVVFGRLLYYYNNIRDVYIEEFHEAYDPNTMMTDVKAIYPDKLVLEYFFPQFLGNEDLLVSSLLYKFILTLDQLLVSNMILPHNRSLHMFESEHMPCLPSQTILTWQWSFYNG